MATEQYITPAHSITLILYSLTRQNNDGGLVARSKHESNVNIY